MAAGRNGGHLTPAVFLDFAHREQLYGSEEAAKTYAIEHYTTTALIDIIKMENLEAIVDFVSSSRLALLMTEEEIRNAHHDYAAAQAAGIHLEHVEWRSKEEMLSVSPVHFSRVDKTLPGIN